MNTDVYKVRIEGIASGGAGLGRIEGKSVFVEGSAPGELVCCRISETHKSWAKAELLDVITPSPERVTPCCPLYGVCGGCNLQHLAYEAQLAAKISILREHFMRAGSRTAGKTDADKQSFALPEIKAIPSPAWEYRNRMQLHRLAPVLRATGKRKNAEDRTGFGLKARRSGEVIRVADCPIADPAIRSLLQKSAAGEHPVSPPPEKDRFTVYAKDGIFLSEGGTEQGRIRLLDREILVNAGVFFQSNGAMLEKLIPVLRETAVFAGRAADTPAMADVFCGVGTFAVFSGGFFSRVDLVEENKSALALARENLRAFPELAPTFFALRDEDWARKGCAHYDFITVDPPRTGLSAAMAHSLAAEGPPFLAYVSCDPATLARDSCILSSGAYDLVSLTLFDFYPQTSHIETLAIFHKGKKATSKN